jgi:hypothetical protein
MNRAYMDHFISPIREQREGRKERKKERKKER